MKLRGWGVVEIMGHRRHVGLLSEVLVVGTPMLLVQVPEADGAGWKEEHTYGGSAIFGMSPLTEAEARAANKPVVYSDWRQPLLPPRGHEEGPPEAVCTEGEDPWSESDVGAVHGPEDCPNYCDAVDEAGAHHFLRKHSAPRAEGDTTPDHPAEKQNLAVWLQCAHCDAWATFEPEEG